MVTLPLWVAGRLRAFFRGEGGAALVGVLEVIPWIIMCVSIVIAVLVAAMVYSAPALRHP